MPVRSPSNVSAAALRNLHKQTAGSIQQIIGLNEKAELGSTSIRFKSASRSGIFSGELTPEQALLEMMAGNAVSATTVTWKTYSSHGKRAIQTTRTVRVKIRNSEVKEFTEVAGFEKWWAGVQADGPVIGDSNRSSSPTRTHGRKR